MVNSRETRIIIGFHSREHHTCIGNGKHIACIRVEFYSKVINREGQEVPAEISEEEVLFDYDLPKDRFRVPYMKRFVKVKLFLNEMSAFSWESFDLVLTDDADSFDNSSVSNNESMISGQTIENESLKLTVNHNGTLSIFDKSLNKVFKDLLVFEDTGGVEFYSYRANHGSAGNC